MLLKKYFLNNFLMSVKSVFIIILLSFLSNHKWMADGTILKKEKKYTINKKAMISLSCLKT